MSSKEGGDSINYTGGIDRSALEIFHDVEKFVINIGMLVKLHFYLVQVAKCIVKDRLLSLTHGQGLLHALRTPERNHKALLLLRSLHWVLLLLLLWLLRLLLLLHTGTLTLLLTLAGCKNGSRGLCGHGTGTHL